MTTYSNNNNGTSASRRFSLDTSLEPLLLHDEQQHHFNRMSTPGPTSTANPFNFTSPFLYSPSSSVSSSSPPTGQFGGLGSSRILNLGNNNAPTSPWNNTVGSPVRLRGSNSISYQDPHYYSNRQSSSSFSSPITNESTTTMDKFMMFRWVNCLTIFVNDNSLEGMVQRLDHSMIVALKNYLVQLLVDDPPQRQQQQQQWPIMTQWNNNVNGNTMMENHAPPVNNNYRSNNNSININAMNSIPPSPRSHTGSDSNNGPEVQITWNGDLPPRHAENPSYSNKVFLGGLPHDVDQECLRQVFQKTGKVTINWPGREDKILSPKRHAYLLYSDNEKVKKLLEQCTKELDRGNEVSWFYHISLECRVEVIPWIVSDNTYPRGGDFHSSNLVSATSRLDHRKTIFVGGLYGKINAHGLFSIMEDLFGPVTHVGIDTDRYKYPIGSARVTFTDRDDYMKAVKASFVEIATATFTKRIQIEPYIIEDKCSQCSAPKGPIFCREETCFRYFCDSCNKECHAAVEAQGHRRISRNFRRSRGGRF